MHSRWSRRSPSGLAGWMLLAVVVAGLFAMHGLGSHGTHSGGTDPAAHALHQVTPEEPGAAGVAAAAGEQTPHEAPADGSGVLEMCLALLVLGVLWLAGRILRRVAWTVPRDAVVARLDSLLATARGPGPPLRAELCLWRC